MELYVAKYSMGKNDVIIRSFTVIDETKFYYTINLLNINDKFKRVSKTALRPFANKSKKGALETLISKYMDTIEYNKRFVKNVNTMDIKKRLKCAQNKLIELESLSDSVRESQQT